MIKLGRDASTSDITGSARIRHPRRLFRSASSLPWLIGTVWNLPNTAVGITLGVVSGALPEWSSGALNFRVRRGIVLWICDALGISAFTVGDCVLYLVPPTRALRVHEGRHIAQYRALGPFFLPVYVLLLMVFGYRDHPLERDARDKEREELGEVGPSRLLQ